MCHFSKYQRFQNFKPRYVLSIKYKSSHFADVLQNKCSYKFSKFPRKKPVLESLFNKLAGLKAYNFTKKRLQHGLQFY